MPAYAIGKNLFGRNAFIESVDSCSGVRLQSVKSHRRDTRGQQLTGRGGAANLQAAVGYQLTGRGGHQLTGCGGYQHTGRGGHQLTGPPNYESLESPRISSYGVVEDWCMRMYHLVACLEISVWMVTLGVQCPVYGDRNV